MNVNSYTAIRDIILNDQTCGVLAKATATLNNKNVKLDLGKNSSGKPTIITYPSAIDEIVKWMGVNSELAKQVIYLFRKFKLKIIDAEKLQRRIANSAIPYFDEVKNLKNNKDQLQVLLLKENFQKTYGLHLNADQIQRKVDKITTQNTSLRALLQQRPGEKQEDINIKADELFKAGVSARTGAENQNIIIFVGNTGSGKSTTMNFLMERKLHSIKKEDLGITSVGGNIIIAEDPVSAIGHKNISKTSYPIVITDTKNKLAHCDWPGFKDTRGTVIEIYNALCGMEVIEKAKSVQGFLFFIDCLELKASRGKAIIENMRFLHLLLQDFKIHQRAVLFVVTKATNVDKLSDIKKVLQESVEEIVRDDNNSMELREFCLAVHEADFLNDTGLGQRVIICDPCGPNANANRREMLQIINNFSYDKNVIKKFGYPISEKVEAKLDMSRVSFIFQAQKTILALQKALLPYWDNAIERANKNTSAELVQKTLEWLDAIQVWQIELKKELSHFTSQLYQGVSKELTETLVQILLYWEKLNYVSGSKVEIENLTDHFDNFAKELKTIENSIKVLWHKRMHDLIKTSFEESLQTYDIQNTLEEVRQHLPGKKLDTLNVKELHALLQKLATAAKAPLLYPNLIEEILTDDHSKCRDLFEIIRINIVEPVHAESVNGILTIKANSKAVALSEILKKTKDSLEPAKEIWIKETPILYFNSSLTAEHFKGKIIFIVADFIDVKNDCVIDLSLTKWRGGAITVQGRLKGKTIFENKQFKLTPKNQAEISVSQKKCQWPL